MKDGILRRDRSLRINKQSLFMGMQLSWRLLLRNRQKVTYSNSVFSGIGNCGGFASSGVTAYTKSVYWKCWVRVVE